MDKQKIVLLLEQLVKESEKKLVEVFTPINSQNGDFSTSIAMKLAGKRKQNPMEIASNIKKKISKTKEIEKIEIATPGYLNFYLKDSVYLANLDQILKEKDAYGQGDLYKGKSVMIEFAHPNPFKTMHIGHLRNISLGESLVRLFEAQGAKVIRTNYQGDVGMHVAKCVWAMSKVEEKTFPTEVDDRVAFLSQCYVEGAKLFEEDDKAKAEISEINRKIYEQTDKQIIHLWRLGIAWSLDKFRAMYKRVDSYFDREYLESETLELGMQFVNEALKKGILVKSQGALVFKGDKFGLDTRVFLNEQGFLTYEGKELGLAHLEFTEFGPLDLCIHNVAVEQISFFKVTFKVEELLNPKLYKGKQYHNAYEFVGLKSGKMSSRRGRVVSAESVLNEANLRIKKIMSKNKVHLTEKETDDIAVGAVKYAYLKMSPFKYLAFDLDASVSFSGDSGPYLQYTYARAQSILRKNKNSKTQKTHILNQEEKLLLRKFIQLKEIMHMSTSAYSPNYLANYLNELAQLFNNYYAKHQVMGNAFRLKLTEAVAQIIKNGLYLLGIKTLERM